MSYYPQPYGYAQPYTQPGYTQPPPQQQSYYQQPPSYYTTGPAMQPNQPSPASNTIPAPYTAAAVPVSSVPTTITPNLYTTVEQERQLRDLLVSFITAPQHKLSYRYPPRVADDLYDVLLDSRRYTLAVNHDGVIDGIPQSVITMRGLLPTTFKGQTYKTPIRVDYPLNYPERSPIVYVEAGAGLKVNARCTFVAQHNGEIYHNCLISPTWTTASNIKLALQQLAAAFSEQPPLCAASPEEQAAMKQQQQQQQKMQEQQQQQSQQYNNQQYQQPKTPVDDTRLQMEEFLAIKLANGLKHHYNSLQTQIKQLNEQQQQLQPQVFKLNLATISQQEQVAHLKTVDAALDADIAELTRAVDELLAVQAPSAAEETTKNTASNPTHHNIDEFDMDLFEEAFLDRNKTITIQSHAAKQLIHEDSTDSSIDDVITSLDNLLAEGKCKCNGESDLEVYLKLLRVLSRRQYLSRALTKKILTEQ